MNSELSTKNIIYRIFIFFIKSLLTLIPVVWLVVEFLLGYVLNVYPLKDTGLAGFFIIVLGCSFISLVIALLRFITWLKAPGIIDQEKNQPTQFEMTLIGEIENAYNNNCWDEVIKIGTVLSRPLWTTGKYKLRVKIGKFIETAAAYLNNRRIQASTLIDDIGWTNFVLGNNIEAKKNILHGIEIAGSLNDYYLMYKGYRHLSGIGIETDNITDAELYLQKSKDISINIIDQKLRKEVLAGIHVNGALLEKKKCNWEISISLFEEAKKIYREIGDKEREVKLYSYIGDNLLLSGKKVQAKDVFRMGLSESKKESRKDGILYNLDGIGRIAVEEGDLKLAKNYFKEALELSQELGLNKKVKYYERKIKEIEANQQQDV